ncbi:MAG: hypothetical protein ACRC1K_10790 [Planctomycetia bacterium]
MAWKLKSGSTATITAAAPPQPAPSRRSPTNHAVATTKNPAASDGSRYQISAGGPSVDVKNRPQRAVSAAS